MAARAFARRALATKRAFSAGPALPESCKWTPCPVPTKGAADAPVALIFGWTSSIFSNMCFCVFGRRGFCWYPFRGTCTFHLFGFVRGCCFFFFGYRRNGGWCEVWFSWNGFDCLRRWWFWNPTFYTPSK